MSQCLSGGFFLLVAAPAHAMHISEGILPLNWAALWFVAALPFVALGVAFDAIVGFDLVFRHQPGDLVSARGRLTNDPRNERDRLTNLEFMHHRIFLDRFASRPQLGCDRIWGVIQAFVPERQNRGDSA